MAETQEFDSEEVLIDMIWTRAHRIAGARGRKVPWHLDTLAHRLYWWDEACRELGLAYGNPGSR